VTSVTDVRCSVSRAGENSIHEEEQREHCFDLTIARSEEGCKVQLAERKNQRRHRDSARTASFARLNVGSY
jgi:hypothetical protein